MVVKDVEVSVCVTVLEIVVVSSSVGATPDGAPTAGTPVDVPVEGTPVEGAPDGAPTAGTPVDVPVEGTPVEGAPDGAPTAGTPVDEPYEGTPAAPEEATPSPVPGTPEPGTPEPSAGGIEYVASTSPMGTTVFTAWTVVVASETIVGSGVTIET
jgi:hypothetical protein